MKRKTNAFISPTGKGGAVIFALVAAVIFFSLPASSLAFQNPRDLLMWGDKLYKEKEYLKAVEYYEQSLKIVTANAPSENILIGSIHIRIGDCYSQTSNFNEALLNFSEALRRGKSATATDPEDAKIMIFTSYGSILDIYDNIGLEKQMLEVTDEFIAFLKEYRKSPLPEEKIPKSNVNNFLAYCYAQKGENLDEALKLIDEALKDKPKSYAMMDTKGWVLYKMGEKKKALKLLEKALKKCEKSEDSCPVIKRHYELVEKEGSK